MTIIDKETFEIYTTETPDILNDGYFECDDLIAPTISILNVKGYTTTSSCSGHAYLHNGILTFATRNIKGVGIPGTYRVEKLIKERVSDPVDLSLFDDGDKSKEVYKLYFKQWTDQEAFIKFKDIDCMPASLPEGWIIYGSDKIYIDIAGEDISPFDFFEKQLTIMKNLFSWADSLPFKSE